jgi:hypothetical protein
MPVTTGQHHPQAPDVAVPGNGQPNLEAGMWLITKLGFEFFIPAARVGRAV